MYWPFLRSKQEELIALKELGPYLSSNLVVPIIKPHDSTSRVEGQISRVLQSGLRVALIINPNEGSPVPEIAQITAMESNLNITHPNHVLPTFEVRPGVSPLDVKWFMNKYRSRTQVFVHRAHTLSTALFPTSGVIHIFESNQVSPDFTSAFFNCRRVIFRDGFKKQSVNGDYPSVSYFDDLAYSYHKLGYDGFGDFAAIGDVPYNTGGGQPSHVALHLTEPQQNNIFHCRHFVSSVPSATTDVQTKYFDALAQLIGYTGSPGVNPFDTLGVSDYCNNYAAGKFPGLGSPKRWSTKHHIQLLHSVLTASSSTPWI